MIKRQLEWDFSTRGDQLRLIDKARFARSYVTNDGKSVSGAIVKAVLRVIDSHAGEKSTCYASVETISAEVCCSDRSTLRALFVLRHQLALLIEQDERNPAGRRWRVHRTICWANLVDLAELPQARSGLNPSQIRASLDATWNEPRCHMEHDQVPHGTASDATRGDLSSYRTEKEPPPPTATSNAMERAAAELVDLKVEYPGRALSAAFSARDQNHVFELIAFYRTNGPSNGWGPGALVQRLMNARYHSEVNRGWPAVTRKAIDSQQAAQREAEAHAKAKAESLKRAAMAEAEQRREAEFGPRLDAMPLLERDEFARRILTELEFRQYRKDRRSKAIRRRLLATIEKSDSET